MFLVNVSPPPHLMMFTVKNLDMIRPNPSGYQYVQTKNHLFIAILPLVSDLEVFSARKEDQII